VGYFQAMSTSSPLDWIMRWPSLAHVLEQGDDFLGIEPEELPVGRMDDAIAARPGDLQVMA